MFLEDLSNELLLMIFELSSKSDLLAVSLVNHKLHQLVEASLYRDIKWTWDKDRHIPIIAFLDTCFARPELFSHVKSISLDVRENTIGTRQNRLTRDITPGRRQHFYHALTALNVPFDSIWRESLRKRKLDGLVALLVSQTHRLRRLILDGMFASECQLLLRLFEESHEGRSSTLHGFRDLSVIGYTTWSPILASVGEATSMSYLTLPRLEHISLDVNWPTLPPWPSIMSSTAIKLKSLTLRNCSSQVLHEFLRHTPMLTKLTWKNSWRREGDFRNLDSFNAAMLSVSATLTDLSLEVDELTRAYAMHDRPCTRADSGELSGITDLKQLTTLSIDMSYLFGSNEPRQYQVLPGRQLELIIPETVRSLTLTFSFISSFWPAETSYDEYFTLVEQYLIDWQPRVPSLGLITCLLHVSGELLSLHSSMQLREFEQNTNTTVKIRRSEPPPYDVYRTWS